MAQWHSTLFPELKVFCLGLSIMEGHMSGHETTGRPLLTAVEYVLEQLVKLYGRTRTHNEKESPSAACTSVCLVAVPENSKQGDFSQSSTLALSDLKDHT